MRSFAISSGLAFFAIVLTGCSDQAPSQGAEDFADRIGAKAEASVAPAQEQVPAQAVTTNAPAAQIPEGAQPTQLQRLGDIAEVDLGTRTGGCTFQEVGREIFYTSGNGQTGRGVIRVGGALVTVDAEGGVEAIKRGTVFSASGVSISVAPTAGNETKREANMVVTDAQGITQSYSGDWICG